MPNIKLIHIPYFVFRNIPIHTPVPKLVLDFKPIKKKYIFINLDMLSFNFSSNNLNSDEKNFLINLLIKKFPNYDFLINDLENEIKIKKNNLIIFRGNYKKLVKLSACSRLFISMRNGLCDVIAASTKKLPMFVIYHDENYPGPNGSPFIKIIGMKEIGYKNHIEEYIFNKKRDRSLTKIYKKLVDFINKYYEE